MTMISRAAFSATLIGLSLAAGLAAAEGHAPNSAAEDAFLDVLPRVEVPDMVEPIPGAVNEEFRHCEAFWPSEYAQAQSGPEARALRDIYGLVRTQNVIATKDCSCVGKVATWQEVERIAAALRARNGIERLTWRQTEEIAAESNRLTEIAETMCGGPF